DDSNARLAVSVYQSQSDALRAEQAALEAQLLGKSAIVFPQDLLDRESDSIVGSMLRSQRAAFAARRDNVSGRKAQLREQIGQLNQEIAGDGAGSVARAEQIKMLDEEIAGLEELYKKGLATKARLLALKRAGAQLHGERGGLAAESAQAHTKQSEIRILELQADNEAQA